MGSHQQTLHRRPADLHPPSDTDQPWRILWSVYHSARWALLLCFSYWEGLGIDIAVFVVHLFRYLLGVQRELPFPAAEGPQGVHPGNRLRPQSGRRQEGKDLSERKICTVVLLCFDLVSHTDNKGGGARTDSQQLWGWGREGRTSKGGWRGRPGFQPGTLVLTHLGHTDAWTITTSLFTVFVDKLYMLKLFVLKYAPKYTYIHNFYYN